MSSANVLPSAPEYAEQLYPMQEITQINAEDFRLKKISDLQTELSNEADHYRQVAKKYKRTHTLTHISAVGLGSLSAGLSSATLATALTGFGIVASPALAGVATVFGLLSAGLDGWMVYFCHYTLKKYIIIYNVHRIKGKKKWREGP